MSYKLVSTVFAQENPCGAGGDGGINLGDCLQLNDGSTVSSVYDTPATLVNAIITNIFAITGVVLFIMIFVAGFKFVTKGKDGMEDAKKILTNALIGFIVMFSAYWIVQIVSLLTGVNIPGITIGN